MLTASNLFVASVGVRVAPAKVAADGWCLLWHAVVAVVAMQRVQTVAAVVVLLSFAMAGVTAVGNVVLINDTTPGTASNDGTINPGEYVGFSSGINNGFGNIIGSASKMYVDSDA